MPIAEPRSCPGCAAAASAPAGTVDGYALRRCSSCGTLFTARIPEGGDSLDYDAYYHEGNLQVPAFVLGRLEDQVAALESYRRLGRWLDVGCGAGTLLHAARNRGWDAIGTEVSHGAVEAVRAAGFEMHEGELERIDLPAQSFDVVSLVEVVEHVPDVRPIFRAALRLLRPGGALYVTTPHGRGISARLLRTRWSVVAPPEHLQLFSVSGLRAALADTGFQPRSMRTHAVNPSELLAALRRSDGQVAAGDRVESGYRLNETLGSSRSGSWVKGAANAVLSATRLGDSIRVVAERPA